MSKTTRKGSGRTKGSFSFVRIPLKDILAKFADQTTPILVGRKWAEQVGFSGLTTTAATDLYEKVEGTTPATAPTVAATDFDNQ